MENKEIDEILNCVSNMNEEQNIAVRNEFVNIELDIQELDEFISKLGKDRDLDARNDQDHKTDHLKLEGNGEKHDESEYKNCANENEFYTEVADSQAPVCTLPVSEPLQEPHSSTLHEEPSPEEIRSKDSLPSDVPLPSQQSSDPYPFKSHQSGHVLLNQGPEIVSVIYTSTPEESSQIFFLEDLGSGNHLHGNVAVLPPGLDSSTFGNSSQIAIQGDGPEISCFSQDMGSECMDSKDKKAKIKKRKQSDNEEHQRDRKKREADRQKYVRLNKCITETMLKSNNSYLQDENKKLSEKITKLNEELYISQIDRGVALAVNPVNGNSTPEKRIKKTLLINKVENLIYCNDDKNAKIVSLKKELQMLHSEFSILNAKILQQLGIASKNQHSEVIHKTSLENRNVKKESFTVDHQDVNIDEDIRHLINEVNLLTNKSGNKDLEIRNLGLRINETKVKIKCIKDYEGKQEMPNSK